MPGARIATFVLCGLTALAVVPGTVALVSHSALGGVRAGVAYLIVALLIASVPFVAALVVSRQLPGNVLGPLLAAEALVVAATASVDVYAQVSTRSGLPDPVWLAGAMQGDWMLLFAPFALLLLFFPDGHLPSPRWRVLPVLLAAVIALFQLGTALTTRAYEDPWQDVQHPHSDVLQKVGMAMLPVFLVLLLACVLSVFRRFRRADSVQRRQIRCCSCPAPSCR